MLDAGVELRDVQIAAPARRSAYHHAVRPARQNLDRHPDYILAACAGMVPGGSPAAGAIQAWQQDGPGKLAATTGQCGEQQTWDQLPGSYLKESWSLVR